MIDSLLGMHRLLFQNIFFFPDAPFCGSELAKKKPCNQLLTAPFPIKLAVPNS